MIIYIYMDYYFLRLFHKKGKQFVDTCVKQTIDDAPAPYPLEGVFPGDDGQTGAAARDASYNFATAPLIADWM